MRRFDNQIHLNGHQIHTRLFIIHRSKSHILYFIYGCFQKQGWGPQIILYISIILIGFSIINHPFWGTPIFGNTHMFYSSEYLLIPIPNSQCIKGPCSAPRGMAKSCNESPLAVSRLQQVDFSILLNPVTPF